MQYDLTRPNGGRVFDYWLGGTHNFEIDRQFANQVALQVPFAPTLTREERSKVKQFVKQYYDLGIRVILDFGSSLPTCDNTHLVAHALDPKIKVVYSDIDPVTAAYGQELLNEQPNAIFLCANAANPRVVLDAPETLALLGDERRVGINFLNLTHLLNDDQVRSAWTTLYDWAAPGSWMAIIVPTENWINVPYLFKTVEFYRRSGIMSYYRTRAELTALTAPWHISAEGISDSVWWDVQEGDTTTKTIINYSMMLYKA